MSRIACRMRPLDVLVSGESRRALSVFPINMTHAVRQERLLQVCKRYVDLLLDASCFEGVPGGWCMRVEVAKFFGYKRLEMDVPEHALLFGSTVHLSKECLVCCRDDVALVLVAPCGHQMCCVCVPRVNEKCHVCREPVKSVIESVFNSE